MSLPFSNINYLLQHHGVLEKYSKNSAQEPLNKEKSRGCMKKNISDYKDSVNQDNKTTVPLQLIEWFFFMGFFPISIE